MKIKKKKATHRQESLWIFKNSIKLKCRVRCVNWIMNISMEHYTMDIGHASVCSWIEVIHVCWLSTYCIKNHLHILSHNSIIFIWIVFNVVHKYRKWIQMVGFFFVIGSITINHLQCVQFHRKWIFLSKCQTGLSISMIHNVPRYIVSIFSHFVSSDNKINNKFTFCRTQSVLYFIPQININYY